MDRRVKGLAAAVGLASVGTFVLVGYVQAAEDRAVAGERLVPVLVVDEAVERGTPGAELGDLVRDELVPAKVRADGAVTELAALDGLVAATDLVPGEQVLLDRFEPAEDAATAVPAGLDEVTLSLDAPRAAGGRLAPGDRVSVLFSNQMNGPQTETILRDVPVVAVTQDDDGGGGFAVGGGGDDEAEAPGSTTALLVTLGVSSPEAERLVFAAEHGTVWLAGTTGDGES